MPNPIICIGSVGIGVFLAYNIGHVGIVVGVSGDTVTIKEMNYLGQYQLDERSLSANSGYIKGYVY